MWLSHSQLEPQGPAGRAWGILSSPALTGHHHRRPSELHVLLLPHLTLQGRLRYPQA